VKKIRYETIWLSDTHLGTSTCQSSKLFHLLNNIEVKQLFLVGDIIDLARMRKRFYWPREHQEVVRRVLKLASKGVRVVYIPGNHDDRLREFVDVDIGGIIIKPYEVHITKKGKRYLVTHGDQFDLVVSSYPLTAVLGGIGYDFLIKINRNVNLILRFLGMRELSLSMKIKTRVKAACKFISNFETLLSKQAKSLRSDGVICGHIHKPEINSSDFSGIEYINCGDWVENCSFIGEDEQGNLSLIYYDEVRERFSEEVSKADIETSDSRVAQLFDISSLENVPGAPDKAA